MNTASCTHRLLAPIYGGAAEHELHHNLKGMKSNFGSYKFWDWAMGTDYHTMYRKGAAAGTARDVEAVQSRHKVQ